MADCSYCPLPCGAMCAGCTVCRAATDAPGCCGSQTAWQKVVHGQPWRTATRTAPARSRRIADIASGGVVVAVDLTTAQHRRRAEGSGYNTCKPHSLAQSLVED